MFVVRTPSATGVYEFGLFRLDAGKGVLWRGGQVVPLPPKALQVLQVLVERSGDVVLKDELMDRVWPSLAVEDANLAVHIWALRKALGTREDGRPYIETLPRRGYRILATPRRLAVGAFPSLAVLPFKALGARTEDDGLGVGMADALITRLGNTGKVVVRPTSAVLRYARSDVDARVAGRELKVDTVLEGSFQRQGHRLRVTAQLVPTTDSGPCWAGRFEEDFTNLFAVQDAVAEQLAQALALELSDSEKESLAKHPTEDVEAYVAYIKGRHFWNRFTGPALEKAFACFREALAKDPRYARAYSGQAGSYIVLGVSGLLPCSEAWSLAAASARQALALDETIYEAQVALAYVSMFRDWEWTHAENEFKRAISLYPTSAMAHQYYALLLSLEGRLDEAELHITQAISLAPVSVVAHSLRGLRSALAGEHAQAREEFLKVVELEPSHFLGRWGTSVALTSCGRHGEAVHELQRVLELSPGSLVLRGALGWSLAAAGRAEEARSVLAMLEELSKRGHASCYHAAIIHARLGEVDLALEWLIRAADSRDPWVVLLGVDPRLECLRTRPELVSTLQRVFARSASGPPRL